MTNDEWMQSLRKRSHDMANVVQLHEARLVRVEERQLELSRKALKIDKLLGQVAELRHQAMVLKWVVGFVSTIAAGCLFKLL